MARGLLRMRLDPAKPAQDLIGWYERRGYRPVGEDHWKGKTYDSVVMEKGLSKTVRLTWRFCALAQKRRCRTVIGPSRSICAWISCKRAQYLSMEKPGTIHGMAFKFHARAPTSRMTCTKGAEACSTTRSSARSSWPGSHDAQRLPGSGSGLSIPKSAR